MKPKLSVKTLYRSPVKTLLTFILLGIVTFAFFSQTAEYAVTAREFNNAAKQYAGVGSAEVAPAADSDPATPYGLALDDTVTHLYQPLTQEQIDAISALPYITATDTRYMTAGISDTYVRLDDGRDFYNFTARCVVEGTLASVTLAIPPDSFNDINITDCKLLAGNPSWDVSQGPLFVNSLPESDLGVMPVISPGAGRSVIIYTPDYKYNSSYVQNLTPGNRYVFVLRFDPLDYNAINKHDLHLGDQLSNPWCEAVWPISGAPEAYLETDAFAQLRKLVEITNADMHTFDMVYTEDMRSIMRFADGDMAILEGRALTPEDNATGAPLCVISREFASANNLKVGDTITMKLGTKLFEQYKNLGSVAVTPERYAPPEKTVTLEIAGIYADTDSTNKQLKSPHWCYSINTVFVPKSLLPVGEDVRFGHTFAPSEFSYKVANAWDIPAFMKETVPKLEKMGLKPVFYDDGWPDIELGFRTARQLSIIKIAVLTAAVAGATGFVVYLFIGRKKKEFAVMRALGTARRISARALLLPLTVVASAAVLAGSCAAWIYTERTVAGSHAFSILKGYTVGTAVPVGAAVGCIVGELLLVLIFALAFLRHIGSLSPLALLQGNRMKCTNGGKKNEPVTQVQTLTMPAPSETAAKNDPVTLHDTALSDVTASIKKSRKVGSLGFVLRFIWKHIRRSVGKSALAVLLGALLFGVVGQLALMKQEYAALCADTDITARFVGGLQLGVTPKIMKTGLAVDPYYEASQPAELNFSNADLVVTNNIARYTGEEADITYANGYDATVCGQFGYIIIAGKALMEAYGLKPGETVTLAPEGRFFKLQQQYIGRYRTEHPGDTITDDKILTLQSDAIMEDYNRTAHTFTIAGVVSTPSGASDMKVFTPGSYAASTLFGAQTALDMAEFKLSDNFRADEFRTFAQQTCDSSTGKVSYIMDTSKLENLINALSLLETMYPIALTAALLIGGFLCCLVIVQSSKETAIMRIQGTTKGKTRMILSLEQLFLGVAGLVIGACAMLAYKGAALTVVAAQLALYAGLYFAVILGSAMVCSGFATRRNVLALLQTKE